MNYIDFIVSIASISLVLAWIPQIYKIIKEKKSGFSYGTLFLYCVSGTILTLYNLYNIPNFILNGGITLNIYIITFLTLFYNYRKK